MFALRRGDEFQGKAAHDELEQHQRVERVRCVLRKYLQQKRL